jgi:DNA transposition AAA+ family ATPase
MHHFDSGNMKGGLIRKTTHNIKKLWARHQVATQIKELKSRVMDVSERRLWYKFEECTTKIEESVPVDPRLPVLLAESNGLVGMDGPREEIVKWFMDEEQQLKVVSIVGFAGLGKTTLAMEVYRTIGGQFQCKASTSVSRNLNLKKLICDLHSQVDPGEHGRLEMMEVEQLVRRLRECLKDKRYTSMHH